VSDATQPPANADVIPPRALDTHRVEMLGRMTAGIAHDFNNLLTIIGTYCSLVSTQLAPESDARADMAEVALAISSAADLSRQLLAFGTGQDSAPRRVDVRVTVARVVGILRRVLGKDIRIETSLAESACVALVDPGQLEQVLMNLALNARDAMPTGGVLHVRTAIVMTATTARRANSVTLPGTYVSIAVEDTGTGIRPEDLERIFDALYTTKEAGQGTGLGLALVQSMVERMGGVISVDSTPGRGSRFTVLLPCYDTPPASGACDASSRWREEPPPIGCGETILLVEDDDGVRSAIRRLLLGLGYDVWGAGTAAEIRAMAIALKTPPTLLLSDVIIGNESGQAIAERLRRRWKGMPVLFMSAYSTDELRRLGVDIPMELLLEKPINTARLGHAVRRAIDGS
jgi:two-component system cell cycle sensor histidine kinase/response regulator CckA